MYCKRCGENVAENDKFCRNCGASVTGITSREYKEKAFWRHGWFTILMLFMCFPVGVILVFINHPGLVKTFFTFIFGLIFLGFVSSIFDGCASNVAEPVPFKVEQGQTKIEDNTKHKDEKIENSSVVIEKPRKNIDNSADVEKTIAIPEQDYFGNKLYEYKLAYKNASTKLQKAEVHNKQVDFLRNYFPKNRFENWKGKIKEIGSIENGEFASVEIECRKGNMVYVIATESVNIKLSGKQTLIESVNPLYKEVLKLKKRDVVEFSGIVIPNKTTGLYLNNWASEKYSVVRPEFVVQFTDIRKTDGK